MANYATNLDLIASSQAQKEVTANALFDAASPAMLFGRRASTSAALTWGYYGGAMMVAGESTQIANGVVTLTASATNYVEADASGVVTSNVSGWTAGQTRLYSVVTEAASVTSYTDCRTMGAANAANAVAEHEAASNPHPQYMTQDESDARYLQSVPAQPFDLTAFYPGIPTASAIVTRVPVARAVTFPASLAGSDAKASAAATAQTDFDVQKNGVSVGTIRFAAAASTATFISSGFSLAAGDVLSIIAPGTADATLANVGIVLAGTR